MVENIDKSIGNEVEVQPFGPKWQKEEEKKGGANRPGQFGGVYRHGETGPRALFKQDNKKNKITRKTKIRPAKIYAEYVTGSILSNIAHHHLGVPKERIAKVALVNAHGDINDPYLQSTFIDGYQRDLWQHAYIKPLQQKFLAQMRQPDKNTLAAFRTRLETAYNFALGKGVVPEKFALLKKAYDDHLATLSALEKSADPSLALARSTERVNQLAHDLALIELATMERPSAVFNHEARAVTDQVFKDNPAFIQEFAELMGPRLLLGDLGVHNGNFGVAKDKDGIEHIVCLDYGAGCLNLIADLNPFDPRKTGLPLNKFYKNHFLEYDKEVITSKQMAGVFIKMGDISRLTLSTYVEAAMDGLKAYDLDSLKKFCQRLGMKPRDYESIQDTAKLRHNLKQFMTAQLVARQTSLQRLGYGIVLEHCITNGKLNVTNFVKACQDYPGLFAFAQQHARQHEFVRHTELSMLDKKSFYHDLAHHIDALKQDPRIIYAQGIASCIKDNKLNMIELANRYGNDENLLPYLQKLQSATFLQGLDPPVAVVIKRLEAVHSHKQQVELLKSCIVNDKLDTKKLMYHLANTTNFYSFVTNNKQELSFIQPVATDLNQALTRYAQLSNALKSRTSTHQVMKRLNLKEQPDIVVKQDVVEPKSSRSTAIEPPKNELNVEHHKDVDPISRKRP